MPPRAPGGGASSAARAAEAVAVIGVCRAERASPRVAVASSEEDAASEAEVSVSEAPPSEEEPSSDASSSDDVPSDASPSDECDSSSEGRRFGGRARISSPRAGRERAECVTTTVTALFQRGFL